MVSQAYHAGLLLVVFGGFLSLNGSGEFAAMGSWLMVLGLLVGLGGVLREGIPERDVADRRTGRESETDW